MKSYTLFLYSLLQLWCVNFSDIYIILMSGFVAYMLIDAVLVLHVLGLTWQVNYHLSELAGRSLVH